MSRIGIYVPCLELGGVQSTFLSVATGLASRGHDVTVVTHDPDGAMGSDYRSAVSLSAILDGSRALRLSQLTQWLNQEQPEMLLSGMWSANITSVHARRRAGIKARLVISDHGAFLTRIKQLELRAWALYPFALQAYRHADALVCVSEGVRRQSEAAFPVWRGRAATIHNPVIDDRFASRLHEDADHEWFRDGRGPVIAALSRLVPVKNYALLVRAFARLKRDQGSPARLMIIGDGPERPALEDLSRSLGLTSADIQFLGFRANPLPLLRQANLFVHSALREGFGNVLVEALGAGLPVISTDCPSGPREILEGGRWGVLTPTGDEAALAAAMRNALSVGGRSQPEAIDRFRSERIIDAYENVLLDRGRHAVATS